MGASPQQKNVTYSSVIQKLQVNNWNLFKGVVLPKRKMNYRYSLETFQLICLATEYAALQQTVKILASQETSI